MSILSNRFWKIAIRKTDGGCGLPDEQIEFKTINNPWWGWAADPFLFEHGGKSYLFAEVYSLLKQKGCLAFCELDGDKKASKWHKIIEEPYHLSYPNIMTSGNDIYICPESFSAKQVYFYKAESFPFKWSRADTLITDSPFSDTTFFNENGRDFGFTFDHTSEPVKLLLFEITGGKAEYLSDTPISTDESTARPGGNILKTELGNIRVGQNGVGVYGSGLAFLKINQIIPQYDEELIKRWDVHSVKVDKMPAGAEGIHTFNRLGNFEVIDIRYRAKSLLDFLGRAIRAVKRRI